MTADFEKPKILSPEEIKKVEEKRERVDKLRTVDNRESDEDAGPKSLEGLEDVMDLAYLEKEFREGKITPEKFSDHLLEKKVAQKESRIDVLTGLANRRSFLETLPKKLNAIIREEKRAKEEREKKGIKEERREKKEISILLVDVDDFKRVNEEFGYAAGDKALKEIADILDESARDTDYVFRYGGEEFIIILDPANSVQADNLAKRIIKKVKDTEIVVEDTNRKEHKLKRTISVGIFSTSQDADWQKTSGEALNKKIEEMLTKVNVAVKEAKKTGKDRGVVFSESMMANKSE